MKKFSIKIYEGKISFLLKNIIAISQSENFPSLEFIDLYMVVPVLSESQKREITELFEMKGVKVDFDTFYGDM